MLKFLKKGGTFVNGGEIEKLAMDAGFKASNASRRLRELCEEGLIQREERKNPETGINSVWYRYGYSPEKFTRITYSLPDGRTIDKYEAK